MQYGDGMMMKQLLLLPFAALAIAAQGTAPVRPEVPVMVGGDSEQDACGGTYRVRGLNPRGENFLAVRSRPTAGARELARLRNGQTGYLCASSADGQWAFIFCMLQLHLCSPVPSGLTRWNLLI